MSPETRQAEAPESFVNTYEEWQEPCTLAGMEKAREGVEQILADAPWITDMRKFQLGHAYNEVVMNAVWDAHKEKGQEEFTEFPEKSFRVSLHLTADTLTIIVEDEGHGYKQEKIYNPTTPENLLKTSGRGLFFAREFFDTVKHDSNPTPPGTTVTLEFYRGGPKDLEDHEGPGQKKG